MREMNRENYSITLPKSICCTNIHHHPTTRLRRQRRDRDDGHSDYCYYGIVKENKQQQASGSMMQT